MIPREAQTTSSGEENGTPRSHFRHQSRQMAKTVISCESSEYSGRQAVVRRMLFFGHTELFSDRSTVLWGAQGYFSMMNMQGWPMFLCSIICGLLSLGKGYSYFCWCSKRKYRQTRVRIRNGLPVTDTIHWDRDSFNTSV